MLFLLFSIFLITIFLAVSISGFFTVNVIPDLNLEVNLPCKIFFNLSWEVSLVIIICFLFAINSLNISKNIFCASSCVDLKVWISSINNKSKSKKNCFNSDNVLLLCASETRLEKFVALK